MRVSETRPRFDPETGRECGTLRRTLHHRCDYCGEVLPSSEGGYAPNLKLRLDYGDCIDTCFGSDGGEFALSEEHGIDMDDFLGQPYCFCNAWNQDGGDPRCEQALALELLSCVFSDMPETHPPEGMAPLRDARCFDVAFRAARVRATAKLIEDGVVTPEQLAEMD